jgi:hypothetical protein
LAALPFIFFTNELHVLPAHILQLQSEHQQQTVQITKRFLNSHLEDMKKEFDNVKILGAATAEEWLKGLEERGKEKKADAARWKRWESTGGVARMSYVEGDKLAGPLMSGNAVVVKKEAVVKTEPLTSSGGTSPISRHQPANPLPPRNFPHFTSNVSSQSIHTSLRKCLSLLFWFCISWKEWKPFRDRWKVYIDNHELSHK